MSEEHKPHALLRPGIAIPFLIVALIWGSTWFVIKMQIDAAPPLWSVAYRFLVATPAMFALAAIMRKPLAMPAKAHGLALVVGLFQFCGNYVFVYQAEMHLTSGIVGVIIGMLLVPNALLGWWLLGQRITRRFVIGSAIALTGITLLLLNEARVAPIGGNVVLGATLAVIAMLAACVANVVQAGPVGRSVPLMTLLGWSMFYGLLADILVAFVFEGVPQVPAAPAFWAGTGWLAIVGSVVTFPLYFELVRKLGAGRAAYNGVLVIVIAMLISTFLEGYSWTTLAVLGGVLAMAGLVVALRARQVA